MHKNREKGNLILQLVIFSLIIFTFHILGSTRGINAYADLKIGIPKLNITLDNTHFNRGERVVVKINSPNYAGEVSYKLTLAKIGSKETTDLTGGYSESVKAGTTYAVALPQSFEAGTYIVTAYIKRAGRNVKYDGYASTVFSIDKDIIINKSDQVYDLYPFGNDIKANMYIKASNAYIKNIRLIGNAIVAPATEGNVYFQNTNISALDISSGIKNIYLYNVNVQKLNISSTSKMPIKIFVLGRTIISNANVGVATEFVISDKSLVSKYTDNNAYSNLAYDKKGKVFTKKVSSSPTTTIGAITTGAGVQVYIPSPEELIMPRLLVGKTTLVKQLPLLPLADNNSPVIEYAAVLLDTAKAPYTLNCYKGNYGMDLSTEPDNTHIKRVCITVSRDATLSINDFKFKLKAHVEKQIKILEDFGIIDNPPEGANMINSRTIFGDSIFLKGNISDGIHKSSVITITIKLK